LIIEVVHLIFHPLVVLAEKVMEFLTELVKKKYMVRIRICRILEFSEWFILFILKFWKF